MHASSPQQFINTPMHVYTNANVYVCKCALWGGVRLLKGLTQAISGPNLRYPKFALGAPPPLLLGGTLLLHQFGLGFGSEGLLWEVFIGPLMVILSLEVTGMLKLVRMTSKASKSQPDPGSGLRSLAAGPSKLTAPPSKQGCTELRDRLSYASGLRSVPQ